MTTLQEYLQEKYRYDWQKRDVESLDFNSLEDITKAELNFDGSNWKSLKEIKFGSRQLEGTLTILGCPKLEKIDCSNNSLTKVDLGSCTSVYLPNMGTNLRELNFSYNEITEIVWPSNLHKIYCMLWSVNVSNNKLPNLDFLNPLPNKLSKLNISGNAFSVCDLTVLGRFTRLEVLKVNDNFFEGSLEPLKNLEDLKELNISDTNISRGWEWLLDMEKLGNFYCYPGKKQQGKKEVGFIVVKINSYGAGSGFGKFEIGKMNSDTNFADCLVYARCAKMKKQISELNKELRELKIKTEPKTEEEIKRSEDRDGEIIRKLMEENKELREKNKELLWEMENSNMNKITDALFNIKDIVDKVIVDVRESYETQVSEQETEETETIAQVEVPPKS